jgi:hypothetical protein
MNDGLYIIIELGAGFAAIIAFLVTFLTTFRRWVLERITRRLSSKLPDSRNADGTMEPGAGS